MWSFRTGGFRRVALFILALAAGLQAGCGFHLRGDVHYPAAMAVTWIEAEDRYTPFYRQLKTALERGGVRVAANPAEAGSVIRILHDETGQRVSSVSVRNTPVEYTVYYVLRYAVDMGGREVVPAQGLSLSRAYNYDETQVLGKRAEGTELRDALAGDMVGTVTRRLSLLK
ncbi:MAG: hypothetical protein IT484_03610 [Gammaproteobacteria bacterium]|nr:hypothetical protein [Gammaproteobacteria bacterium]